MRSVIVFAGALYDSPLWTNRQEIATRLAARGWLVFYVEPRLLLPRMLLRSFPGRWGRWRWLRRMNVPAHPRENLWVWAQFNILPWSREVRWISTLNHLLNAWGVWLWARWLGVRFPCLLLYDTEAAQYLRLFPRSRVVYDCVDDHRAQAGSVAPTNAVVARNPARVAAEERAIAERADAIAVTTEPLRQRFQGARGRVVLVPNAADVERFAKHPAREPADIAGIPHPRIGTVGALDAYKIDVVLLAAVARLRPNWHFVLVGPVNYAGSKGQATRSKDQGLGITSDDVHALQKLPNVHFLGYRPPEDVPAYVHAFDVAIIPYRASPYNTASFPLKFWEFVAAGKPVVASGLPALERYRHLVCLTDTSDNFLASIEEVLRDPGNAAPRQRESRAHDWETRVTAIEALLSGGRGV